MKKPRQYKKIIRIKRVKLNPFNEQIGDYVIKLAYHFDPVDQPRMEIYKSCTEATDSSWSIYGAPDESLLLEHTFTAPGETVPFTNDNDIIMYITYQGFATEMYTYSPTVTQSINVYTFELTIIEK